jgi:tetratricopeptide (TPR) repeat protein
MSCEWGINMRLFRILLTLVAAACCALSASTTSAQAWEFGTTEHVERIEAVAARGPQGEKLFLGYKYSRYSFLGPYWMSDDGYVLGVEGSSRYFSLDADKIAALQKVGQLPAPLPPYKIGIVSWLYGFFLWIVLGGYGLWEGIRHFWKKRTAPLAPGIAAMPLTTEQRALVAKADIHMQAGLAFTDRKELDKAISEFDAGTKIAPFVHGYQFIKANTIVAKLETQTSADPKEVEMALAAFAAIIDGDPEDKSGHLYSALLGRGELLRQIGQNAAAVPDLSRALDMKKTDDAYVSRGRAYTAIGELNAAITDFDAAAVLEPEWYAPVFRRAEANELAGNIAAANADYSKANELRKLRGFQLVEPKKVTQGVTYVITDQAQLPTQGEIAAAIRKRFPLLGPDESKEPPSAPATSVVEIIDGLFCAMMFIDRPNPLGPDESFIRTAYGWPDSWKHLQQRKGHVIINVGLDEENPTKTFAILAKLTAAVIEETKGAFAVISDEADALWRSDLYLKQVDLSVDALPLSILVAVKMGPEKDNVGPDDRPTVWARTKGLEGLGFKEIETRYCPGAPIDVAATLLSMAKWLVVEKRDVQHGHTIGIEGMGQHAVRVGPSTLVARKDVYAVELGGLSRSSFGDATASI